jgi:RNA polymerase sigma-70 factor, ECF subfamily
VTQPPVTISGTAVRESADQNLLTRIDQGEKFAMQLLFARHKVRVFRFVLRFVSDEALAEDLVNEVFVAVWKDAGKFKGNSQVSTWILAIARFQALTSLRRRKELALDDVHARALPDSADNPEISLQKKDRVAILRECMSHLSLHHREMIDLFYYQDKSFQEVAALVGVPRNTVKTRMFYARKRMSELLAQAGIDRSYQ